MLQLATLFRDFVRVLEAHTHEAGRSRDTRNDYSAKTMPKGYSSRTHYSPIKSTVVDSDEQYQSDSGISSGVQRRKPQYSSFSAKTHHTRYVPQRREPEPVKETTPFSDIEKSLQYVMQTSDALAQKDKLYNARPPADRKHGYLDVSTTSRPTTTTDRIDVPSEAVKEARALHSFRAQNSRELGFKKGDILRIRLQLDANWYEGEANGRVGIFPTNYVQLMSSSPMRSVSPAVQAKPESRTTDGQARVLFNFSPRNPRELNIRKGETVVLSRKVDANWWEGRSVDGQVGIFPANYVDVMTEPGQPQKDIPIHNLNHQPAHRSSAFTSSRSTHQDGGISRLQVNGSVVSKKVQNETSRSQRTKQSMSVPRDVSGYSEKTDRSFPVPSPKLEDIDTYQALYAYMPLHSDELELEEGDVVMVMEKCNDGWFIGTSLRTGQFGTFPGNYVQLL